jgi:transcriptional regulator with XRE-family HTH domain
MPSEMEMQKRLEERMKALLEHANYQSVATALGVSRTAVWRWSQGKAVTPGAVTRVQALLRPDLPDTTKEAAEPLWAQRLIAKVDQVYQTQVELADAASRRVIEALAPDDLRQAALEADARLAAELEQSRRKSGERAGGPTAAPGGASLGSKRQSPK